MRDSLRPLERMDVQTPAFLTPFQFARGAWLSVARGDRRGRRREAVVEAELHDIDLTVEVEVVDEPALTGRESVVEVDVSMAELHEVVFELPRPVAPSSVLEAHTEHPAGPRVV